MKKIIIIITIILLTGCLGDLGKGYITKKCKKQENINGKIKETEIEIKSKQGNVETITITEKYDKEFDLISIINSKTSEKNSYKNESGITLDISEQIFRYKIQAQEISEYIKEKFNIEKEQYKQIKIYEENGYQCK